MQSLTSFINENSAIDNIVSTKSNSSRRYLLKKYLKGKYTDYLNKLEEMCKDPKARALLDDAFGGELGDTELKFSNENIAVKRLMPTQNSIGLESSLKHLLKKGENVSDYFIKDDVEIISPIVTFNKMYVIDGHHRWSEILIANPNAKVVCINYDGDLSVIQMLKAVQGAIAASVDYVPQSTLKGKNIYKASDKEIKDYIDENLTEETIEGFVNNVNSLESIDDVKKYIFDNCKNLVDNYPIIPNSPDREKMPQTSKGRGLEPDGALDKMKNGDVLKV